MLINLNSHRPNPKYTVADLMRDAAALRRRRRRLKLGLTILFLLLLSSCGVQDYTPSPILRQQRADYLQWVKPLQGPHGFISTTQCDSLLHSALLAAGGAEVDVTAAREASGRWLRRPTDLPECLSVGESRSTISRDQILGVMVWAVMGERRDVLEALWQFGVTRDWKMGDSDNTIEGISRIYLSPNLIGTIAQAIYYMGGADHPERFMRLRITTPNVGFRRHLDLLDIMMRDRLGIDRTALDIIFIEAYRRELRDNPLVQLLAGKYVEAERLLLRFNPVDRLPNSGETCGELTYQRDILESCPGVADQVVPVHFILLSRLLIEKGDNVQ